MYAAQIVKPNEMTTLETDEPQVGSHDVLIRVHNAGICGTDIHILHGEYMGNYPIIPGHEFSGTVAAVGDSVTRYKVGDRVTADPNIPCNICYYCQHNQPNQCENLAAIGVTRSGGFAEYVTAPEACVFPIGEMSFSDAALIEPLACVVWGLHRVQVQAGDSALVLGAGPMGYLVAQSLQHAGASTTIISDVVSERLALTEQLELTGSVIADDKQAERLKQFAPHGFDIVVDATGIAKVVEQAFAYVRPRGKVWVFGVVPEGKMAQFSPYEVFRKDLTVIGSFAVNRTFNESIALINSGAIQVTPLVSHKFPLQDFVKGMEVAQNAPDRMKIQFEVTT